MMTTHTTPPTALPTTRYSISALVPVHNEEEALPTTLKAAAEALDRLTTDWEIVVVESGSRDRSLEVVQAAARDEPRIRWVHQRRREGMGSALRAGYALCTKEWVCHLEADMPFDLSYLAHASEHFDTCDFVAGYRAASDDNEVFWRYSKDSYFETAIRGVYHYGYRLFLTLVFGIYVGDINFSFKVIRKEFVDRVQLRSRGWFIDTELVFELIQAGARIRSLPVRYRDRQAGRSTVSLLAPLPQMKDAILYRLRRWKPL